jgi:hypothetical protein
MSGVAGHFSFAAGRRWWLGGGLREMGFVVPIAAAAGNIADVCRSFALFSVCILVRYVWDRDTEIER